MDIYVQFMEYKASLCDLKCYKLFRFKIKTMKSTENKNALHSTFKLWLYSYIHFPKHNSYQNFYQLKQQDIEIPLDVLIVIFNTRSFTRRVSLETGGKIFLF